jgi:hypothetical protein
MPDFKIIPSRPWHCGYIARRVRAEHKAAIVSLGFDLHEQIAIAYRETLAPKTWLRDGKIVAVGGVCGGPCEPSGLLWLALSREAVHFPMACVREGKRQIEQAMHTRHELTANIVSGDKAALRFALYLGFEYDSAAMGMDRRVVYMRYRRLAMEAA